MIAEPTKQKMNAEELLQLPTGMGAKYELIEGELIEMSPTGLEHGNVTFEIGYHFVRFLKANPIGKITGAESGFIIDPLKPTVRAPDVAFIPAERIPAGGLPAGFAAIIPALVVEVVSPSENAAMVQDKTNMWLTFGVSQVWNVYPELGQVVVFERSTEGASYRVYAAGATIGGGALLPGFELPVSEIFGD